MKLDNKRKRTVLIVSILLLTIGVTFAYFMARTGAGASANTNIKADTVDDLKFSVSKENLSLNINQFNFASGSGNLSDTIKATASLKANSTKNTATYNYYVYFQIESNEYIYTTTDKKSEIVLSITGPNGEITSVDGLTYVSATNADGTKVKGFDITEQRSSVIKVADTFEISSSSSKNYTNQDWTVTVTFINLDSNQADNEGKTLIGKVLIQKEKIPTSIADICSNGDNLNDCIVNSYNKLGAALGLYYHDANLTNGAGDNSYRYSGANPNNYVCFGSNESTCPTDNLYRIIGVFGNNVKLIKYDYGTTDELGTDGDYYKTYKEWGMGSTYKGTYGDGERIGVYYWNKSTQKNTWSESLLNKTNLNTNFINNIGEEWANKIATTTWKVGGNKAINIDPVTPSVAYQNEIVNPVTSNTIDNAIEYSAKIGLMYASDYGFAAEPSAWTLTMNNYNNTTATSTNWMYMGLYEWTVFRYADYLDVALDVASGGHVNNRYVYLGNAVRPSFNLTSSVKYNSGSGTSSDPIRLKI